MTETPKAQTGMWTLIAPDGREWHGGSPLALCAAEQRERVPAGVALQRIQDALDEDRCPKCKSNKTCSHCERCGENW